MANTADELLEELTLEGPADSEFVTLAEAQAWRKRVAAEKKAAAEATAAAEKTCDDDFDL